MKHKKLKNFFTGVITLAPILLFILIIKWVVGLLFGGVNGIISIFPQRWFLHINPWVIDIIGAFVIVLAIWFVGFIMNQYFGKKLKLLLKPVVDKIPLLNTLVRVTNQINSSLTQTNSFKKVVLLKFPSETTWSLGFLTGEQMELFERNVCVESGTFVSVFIPTTPNPTNGYLVMVDREKIIETEIPVKMAVSFIISMGTTGATSKILESYRVSE